MARRQSDLPTRDLPTRLQAALSAAAAWGEFTSGATPAVRPPASALLFCSHASFAASAPRGTDLFIILSIPQQPCKTEWCSELLSDVPSSTAGSREG